MTGLIIPVDVIPAKAGIQVAADSKALDFGSVLLRPQ